VNTLDGLTMPPALCDSRKPRNFLQIFWQGMLCWLALIGGAWAGPAQPQADPLAGGADITLQARYWVDASGQSSVDDVASKPAEAFQSMEAVRSFKLHVGALWMRLDLSRLDPSERWYLALDASAFTDLATLYQAGPDAAWHVQQSGDHLPVAQWSIADRAPTFSLNAAATPGTVWLRLENRPTPLSPRLYLLTEDELQHKRHWAYLLIGGYLGFGLLVMFLGWVHARLYADRAFVAYVIYVASMLGFQVSFTGLGGLFFWPHWAWWNNAAPALFMLWLTASGIWFVREACSISRHHRGVDRAALGWSLFGLVFSFVYVMFANEALFAVLSLYGLLSVLLSIALCLWAWRQGERYAGWLLLGFLPVHIGYPFPALRSTGLLPDSWAAQYAVLIGSAIEIPLLLYILHRRAKDFNENRARMRALDSTDPLTGLTVTPVLRLRLRDALRRARRYGHSCGLLLVDLSNFSEIVALEGREGGDRALVVAASRLTRVVRDVDTVCRVTETRFAILVEGPQRQDQLKLLAQHIVAKGLEQGSILPGDVSLRFRLVSTLLPADTAAADDIEDGEERRILARLGQSLDELATDPRKVVLHLPQQLARR
jgi:two-component system, sensor histidine kinase LadS